VSNQGDFTYFKNLDGLRAIAAFSVILFHCGWWFTYPDTRFYHGLKFLLVFGGEGGHLGVKFFFVLSGFLITYLMFSEQAKRGKLNVPYFYLRRILRIWPLYYLTLIAGFLIYPWLMHLAGKDFYETASGFLYSVFAANFDNIYNGYPKSGILGVQWSVAVEEQFYLLWPLMFFAFSRKNFFPFLLLVIIIFSELFYFNAETFEEKTFHLFSCFRFLAFGGLLAWLCFRKPERVRNFFGKINKALTFFIYVVCILLLFFQRHLLISLPWYQYINHFLPLLFFGFVIVEQNYSSHSFFKIGSFRILNWLGKISYGLYLTHMIAIYIAIAMFPQDGSYVLLKILSAVLITVLISHASYYYIESFFLSLKNKFSIIKTTSPQAA
jgi:peptidoglycan/LPS O-acetylase OafA/YrhL